MAEIQTDEQGNATVGVAVSLLNVVMAGLALALIIPMLFPKTLIETHYVSQVRLRYEIIETDLQIDGKVHKVMMKVPVHDDTNVPVQHEVVQRLTWADTIRLSIIGGIAAVFLVYAVVILIITTWLMLTTKKALPKHWQKLHELVLAGLIGVVVGFAGGSQVTPEKVPASQTAKV